MKPLPWRRFRNVILIIIKLCFEYLHLLMVWKAIPETRENVSSDFPKHSLVLSNHFDLPFSFPLLLHMVAMKEMKDRDW